MLPIAFALGLTFEQLFKFVHRPSKNWSFYTKNMCSATENNFIPFYVRYVRKKNPIKDILRNEAERQTTLLQARLVRANAFLIPFHLHRNHFSFQFKWKHERIGNGGEKCTKNCTKEQTATSQRRLELEFVESKQIYNEFRWYFMYTLLWQMRTARVLLHNTWEKMKSRLIEAWFFRLMWGFLWISNRKLDGNLRIKDFLKIEMVFLIQLTFVRKSSWQIIEVK